MPKNEKAKVASEQDAATKPEGQLFNFPEHGLTIRAENLEEATKELNKRIGSAN